MRRLGRWPVCSLGDWELHQTRSLGAAQQRTGTRIILSSFANSRAAPPAGQLYLSDNVHRQRGTGAANQSVLHAAGDAGSPCHDAADCGADGLRAHDGGGDVWLSFCRMRAPGRGIGMPIDTGICSQVVNADGRESSVIHSQVGGYPPLAEHTRALTTPANPFQYNGAYTNLERWSHAFVEGGEPPISVGPPARRRGHGHPRGDRHVPGQWRRRAGPQCVAYLPGGQCRGLLRGAL